MLHQFHDPSTRATFTLTAGAPAAQRPSTAGRVPLLSIAWNRGPAQTAWVDGVPLVIGQHALVALMTTQTFRFEHPAHVVLWQFNREFYCIVDHDREVSCVGLLFYGSRGTTVLQPGVEDCHRLANLLTVFEDEFGERDAIQGEMLRSLLKRLIIILTRLARKSFIGDTLSQSQLDVVRQFNLLVEQHYRTRHRVSDYAALMHKAPKTLANLFAAHGERTPLQVIHERITIEARRLLLYTEASVKQVAGDLGFADAATFSRFFKGNTGASPLEFRSRRHESAVLPAHGKFGHAPGTSGHRSDAGRGAS